MFLIGSGYVKKPSERVWCEMVGKCWIFSCLYYRRSPKSSGVSYRLTPLASRGGISSQAHNVRASWPVAVVFGMCLNATFRPRYRRRDAIWDDTRWRDTTQSEAAQQCAVMDSSLPSVWCVRARVRIIAEKAHIIPCMPMLGKTQNKTHKMNSVKWF